VRDRCDVCDARNPEAGVIERPHRRLPTGPGALDVDIQVFQPKFLERPTDPVRRYLSRERSALSGAAKAGAASGRPTQRISLPVGDGNDGVVEGSVDMSNPIRHLLFDLLLGLGRFCHGLLLPGLSNATITC